MPLRAWWTAGEAIASDPRCRRLQVDANEWLRVATDAVAAGGQLMALWASPGADNTADIVMRAALLTDPGLLVLELPLSEGAHYRGLQEVFPAASRMQRAAFDLMGARSDDDDTRPWLRHAAWAPGDFPLRPGAHPASPSGPSIDAYPFVRVEGDGVHEVPVGPVHAGTIEPGHFRFSIVGEKVLRLEERLGYVHKGIEHRFTQLGVGEAHKLAARVSGDSAVAFSWAYCQALEGLADCTIPKRASMLRALCLELERIANHLGDLGALGNDAGFAFGLAQFSRLKEEFLRTVEAAFGQRYLMDTVVPGGLRADLRPDPARALADRAAAIAVSARGLQDIYDEHAGVRDRFAGAGRVSAELARRLGLTGLAGRASAQPLDLRVDLPIAPYDELAPEKIVREEGDVAARVAVRFAELEVSCGLVERIVKSLPPGEHCVRLHSPRTNELGIGLVEGWRGPVFVALELAADGSILRCHPHDPSWQNWPVLEHAIIDNIVPDFPLINKSFNLSYSGHDL